MVCIDNFVIDSIFYGIDWNFYRKSCYLLEFFIENAIDYGLYTKFFIDWSFYSKSFYRLEFL